MSNGLKSRGRANARRAIKNGSVGFGDGVRTKGNWGRDHAQLKKGQALVFMNAQGGPRIVGMDEPVHLGAPTADGEEPKFVTMDEAAARKIIRQPETVQPVAKPKDGRQPTLADKLLLCTNPMLLDQRLFARLKKGLRDAQKFVFTAAAAERIGNAIAAYPELLVDNGPFAIPPHEHCWIELPAKSLNGGVIGHDKIDTLSDQTVGYLIADYTVWVAAEGDTGCSFSPLSIDLNHPLTMEEERHLANITGITRLQLDAVAWGQTLYERVAPKYKSGLRAMHGMHFTCEPKFVPLIREEQMVLKSCAGEIRNILGILLALNQPSNVVQKEGVGHYRKMTSKGPRPYMAHTVVELHLDRKPIKRLLDRPVGGYGDHASPRWHNVRGHFVHNKAGKSGTCAHEWREYEGRKWECLLCDGKRRWREYPNGRGDASKGMVLHTHRVDV